MRNRNRIFLAALSIGLALGLLTVVAALAAINIDDFAPPGPSLTLNIPASGAAQTTEGFATGGIGGERDLIITGTTTTGSGLLTVQVISDTFNSRFYFAASPSVFGEALLQWDGEDGSRDLDPNGLGGVNLAAQGNGFHIDVLFDDIPADIIMTVYSGAASSTATLQLPGNITGAGGYVSFFIPFSEFSDPTIFNSVGAIEMKIDGTTFQGLDLELDLVAVDTFRDFGDLPLASYGIASHIPTNGARLGNYVDLEPQTIIVPGTASGDDTNRIDDEDGVFPTPGINWTSGPDGGSLSLIVRGCLDGCYLNGWIDWAGNGTFENLSDVGDHIFIDERVTSGNPVLTFDIPEGVNVSNQSFFSRFRICPVTVDCSSSSGEVTGGEVEDHLFSFGPTAVTLTSLTAESSLSTAAILVVVAIAFVAVMAVAVVIELRRQRRSHE